MAYEQCQYKPEVIEEWFKRDIQWAKWDAEVEVRGAISGENFNQFAIRIYTDTNCYLISAHIHKDGHGYLGCIASSRKPRAGEEHTRGNDLPDGPLDENTWRKILYSIVGYELVKIHRPTPAQAEAPE